MKLRLTLLLGSLPKLKEKYFLYEILIGIKHFLNNIHFNKTNDTLR